MIVLADMGYLFFKAYYATRSDISAYEITVDKLREYHEAQPRFAICCDCGPIKRAEIYPEYKTNREEKPREAIDSLRAVEQQAEGWGTPILRCPGYEADDLLATLVAQADGEDIRIVSQDKDLFALISERVWLVKMDGRYIDNAACVAKFGVRPDQITDFLTLVGDTSDNIPGCPSVGPGRARDLLVKFGTLDDIMKATDEELLEVRGVGKKTLDGLRGWDPTLARSLVKLDTDAPVSLASLWPNNPPATNELVVNW